MSDKETFLKHRLSELSNQFKAIAELSDLAVSVNDTETVKSQNIELNNIYKRILNIVKTTENQEIYRKIKKMELTDLPEYLNSIELVDAYQKLLSLKYTNIETDSLEETAVFNKMSVEYNYAEEIPYLVIARALCDKGYYKEALKLCEFILTITTTAPVYSIMGDAYGKLGEYGLAIDSYQKYITLNDGDDEAIEKLNELYEESFK